MHLFQDLDNPVLTAKLVPLEPLLAAEGVVEVAINRPGEAWLRIDREGWVQIAAPQLTRDWASGLCHTLGSVTHRAFTASKPLLRCSLPGGHRFTAMLGPNVTSGMMLAIRVRRFVEMPLDAYGMQPADIDALGRVAQERPVIIIGDRGSGKTTFLNSLAQMVIPPDDRVVTVEDVEEIRLVVPNCVQFVMARGDSATQIDYADLADTLTRLMAEWLIFGELSVHNAAASYRLMNAGTLNLLGTAHANQAGDLFEAWRRNYEMATGRSGESLIPFLQRTIGRIVQLGRDRDDRRRVLQILDPATLDLGELMGGRSRGPDWAAIGSIVREALDRLAPGLTDLGLADLGLADGLAAGVAAAGGAEAAVQRLAARGTEGITARGVADALERAADRRGARAAVAGNAD